ncbi:glycosyltransferase family 4 protein [Salinimicrobium xinjiangense]|uniref:glycosyltransferase family 4 protein n=1 Tax=Salinimicrobium xinjiangense TaxID=438596 RepID=UPI0003FFA932|nr:glycosyltransferase family 4 protein [Salinimicrobium xinjiangense]
MRILFLSSGNSDKGISPIFLRQGESISKLGPEIVYFSIRGKGLKGYMKNMFAVRRSLKTSEYDVVHAHYGLTGIIALLSVRKEKVVISFMGDDICGSNSSSGKVTVISRYLSLLNSFLAGTFYDQCIVKSEEMFLKIKRPEKTVIIPNGVDLKCFRPLDKFSARQELEISHDKKVLLFASDPSRPEKNFDLARKSISLLENNKIEIIPLVGISQDKLVKLYNAADVLLLSSFHEGSPNVIKEAMACNCPIVSTKVGDVNWVMQDTEGCFISSFDPKEYSEKIKAALLFSKIKGRTQGRKRILDLKLDSQSVAEKIIKIYHNI